MSRTVALAKHSISGSQSFKGSHASSAAREVAISFAQRFTHSCTPKSRCPRSSRASPTSSLENEPLSASNAQPTVRSQRRSQRSSEVFLVGLGARADASAAGVSGGGTGGAVTAESAGSPLGAKLAAEVAVALGVTTALGLDWGCSCRAAARAWRSRFATSRIEAGRAGLGSSGNVARHPTPSAAAPTASPTAPISAALDQGPPRRTQGCT